MYLKKLILSCIFISSSLVAQNPLEEIGITEFSGTKINQNQWYGSIDTPATAVFAVVTKNAPDKEYKYSIEYIELPEQKLKYVNDKPIPVTQQGYYSMPKGLFRAASGLIVARKPGTKGKDPFEDFWGFRWDAKQQKWLEVNTNIDLTTTPRYEHPTQQVAEAFKSDANRQKPATPTKPIKKPTQPKAPPAQNNLSALSSDLQNLQGKLSGLQGQLESMEKGVPLPKAKAQKIDNNTFKINDVTIHIQAADITSMNVDAIVNAANKTLMKDPGGVADAIWKAAGADQLNDWIANNLAQGKTPGTDIIIEIGQAKWTPSFNLLTNGIKGIIQAVGPDCRLPNPDDINLLYNAYKNSIRIANEKNYSSIAFPAISTNIFACDKQQCAQLAVRAIIENAPGTSLKDIYLVNLKLGDYEQKVRDELDKYTKK